MIRKLLLLFGMAVCLCGCPRSQKYNRPGLPVPPSWPERSTGQAGVPDAPAAADMKWQEFFTDGRLRSVIELALANNRDLRMAVLNIEKFQALYRIQRSGLYPGVGVLADGQEYRLTRGVNTWSLSLTTLMRKARRQ